MADKKPNAGWLKAGYDERRTNSGPKGFAKSVRRLVSPEELITFSLSVMRGEPQPIKTVTGFEFEVDDNLKVVVPDLKERQRARDWLADRGWGKEVQILEIAEGEPRQLVATEENFDGFSLEEKKQYLGLLEKARAAASLASGATIEGEAEPAPLELTEGSTDPEGTEWIPSEE